MPHESKPKVISLLDAQSIVDTCKDNVHLNNVGQMVMKEASDEDIVSGQLTITIHKMLGLQDTCGKLYSSVSNMLSCHRKKETQQ